MTLPRPRSALADPQRRLRGAGPRRHRARRDTRGCSPVLGVPSVVSSGRRAEAPAAITGAPFEHRGWQTTRLVSGMPRPESMDCGARPNLGGAPLRWKLAAVRSGATQFVWPQAQHWQVRVTNQTDPRRHGNCILDYVRRAHTLRSTLKLSWGRRSLGCRWSSLRIGARE